ncbi:pentatricopeptide repeat-containing protein At1g01970-like [Zingiber officinale]|uniref:PROP1-like PPR domain-containing protein n=1 Tax=Zingiber officinale TaxID=94328 RepID=A0A8J5KR24_ZINOF|nr:pentatricopeptide repeat-containing protein At1g01970-like [Zingiber officinale]KAG6488747.1 hypothetical protein ZIOFF_049996 [Zingiber officinale]
MPCLSPILPSNIHLPSFIISISNNIKFSELPFKHFFNLDVLEYRMKLQVSKCSLQSTSIGQDGESDNCCKKESKMIWTSIGSNITEAQKKAISQLPLKMSNRCKALLKRIICFSTETDNLSLLLAVWVKAMKPRRADWLSVLKQIERMEHHLLFEVMEYALLENSFEANVRDYTKLIGLYAKQNLLENAERSFCAMKQRGFPYDQVTLTVLIHMYSKAGHFDHAKEAFEEIELLGVPVDKRAYGSMIMAYVRAEMLESAEALMKELEEQEIYPRKEVYKALLRAYSNKGNAGGAQKVFDSIQFAGIVPDSRHCALLISAYCIAGQSVKARTVLENMRLAGLEPNDRCIALMLGAYERENDLNAALSFLIELEHDGILVAEESSLVLARWFSRLGVVGEVQQILEEFASRRDEYCATLNASTTKSGNASKTKRMMKNKTPMLPVNAIVL